MTWSGLHLRGHRGSRGEEDGRGQDLDSQPFGRRVCALRRVVLLPSLSHSAHTDRGPPLCRTLSCVLRIRRNERDKR